VDLRRPPAPPRPGVDPGPPRLGRATFNPLRPPPEVRPSADATLRRDAPSAATVARDPRRRYASSAPAAATDSLRLGLPRRYPESLHAIRPHRRPEPDVPASVPLRLPRLRSRRRL